MTLRIHCVEQNIIPSQLTCDAVNTAHDDVEKVTALLEKIGHQSQSQQEDIRIMKDDICHLKLKIAKLEEANLKLIEANRKLNDSDRKLNEANRKLNEANRKLEKKS